MPPSSLMSRRAPSSMPDAFENGCPLMLFASSIPGIDVMRIATFPLFATMLPGAGAFPFADAVPDCVDDCVDPPGVSLGRGAFAALLLFDPFMFPFEGEFPAPLPGKDELINQLHEAGFQRVQTLRLIPGEELFAFRALSGANA